MDAGHFRALISWLTMQKVQTASQWRAEADLQVLDLHNSEQDLIAPLWPSRLPARFAPWHGPVLVKHSCGQQST
jgi:hypothetical protein